MVNMLLASGLQSGDLVGFTFFLGSVAMFAATVFFFVERSSVSDEWKLSMTVSGLITLIPAVHYYYMRDVWVTSYTSPTEFRYIDWILTVPLMCVEFYLLTKTGLTKMVSASVVMLVAGYLGEASVCSVFGSHSPAVWGLISGLAYFYIVNEIYRGDIAEAAALVSCCNLFIGNDSGPMNIAAAVGIATIGLFGVTAPLRYSEHIRPLSSPANNRRMAAITVEEVSDLAMRLGVF